MRRRRFLRLLKPVRANARKHKATPVSHVSGGFSQVECLALIGKHGDRGGPVEAPSRGAGFRCAGGRKKAWARKSGDNCP